MVEIPTGWRLIINRPLIKYRWLRCRHQRRRSVREMFTLLVKISHKDQRSETRHYQRRVNGDDKLDATIKVNK